jgi:hypothetical protein
LTVSALKALRQPSSNSRVSVQFCYSRKGPPHAPAYDLPVAAPGSAKRYFENPVLPFLWIGRRPHEHQRLDDLPEGRAWLDEKHAWTRTPCLEELAKVSRHRPEIVGHKNSILLGGQRQNVRITNPLELRKVGGQKIRRGFPSQAPRDDCVTEAGIRQEADHQSALRRLRLTAGALQLLLQIGRRWVLLAKRILYTLTGRHVFVHLVLVSQVESDGPAQTL